MAYYFKRLYPTLQWQVNYGYRPDSIRGILGQYGVMANGLGRALMLLFGIAFLWMIWKVIKSQLTRTQEPQTKFFAILLLAIFVHDLPMMISYNYQLRYFLTLMPFLAVLSAFFIEQVYQQAKAINNKAYPIIVSVMVSTIVFYSLARIISLMLLVVNDARIPAPAFTYTLPAGTSLEHTYYPPALPSQRFKREPNYPIYFIKNPNDTVPESKRLPNNTGEAGLNDRQTDYLVLDSFTYEKFNDPYTCDAMPVECAFFKQLETGQSDHYKLLAEFKYTLPPYHFQQLNPLQFPQPEFLSELLHPLKKASIHKPKPYWSNR